MHSVNSNIRRQTVAAKFVGGLRRCLLQLVLATLLITAQHGALTHAVGHLQDALGHAAQFDFSKFSTQSGSCDFHITFAQVIGGVGSAAMQMPMVAVPVERAAAYVLQSFPSYSIVPASRGPPLFL